MYCAIISGNLEYKGIITNTDAANAPMIPRRKSFGKSSEFRIDSSNINGRNNAEVIQKKTMNAETAPAQAKRRFATRIIATKASVIAHRSGRYQ